jgi:hypothetical protein
MRKTLLLAVISFSLFSCTASINETVYIQDGETKKGDVNSINGSIIIGNDCKVYGDCRAVNGRIEVGANSLVSNLQSINGSIKIERNTRITGSISAVNGRLYTAEGVRVDGGVSSINGNIDLTETIVAENVETVNGDIILTNGTVVEMDIIVKGKSKWGDDKRQVDINLESGAQVKGNIEVEDQTISVTVYVSDNSKILGDVINAEIIYQ